MNRLAIYTETSLLAYREGGSEGIRAVMDEDGKSGGTGINGCCGANDWTTQLSMLNVVHAILTVLENRVERRFVRGGSTR
eukprot:m.1637210 g.1637210  ORF g.1637210 m.1637210 type:complete len:80 (-) comp25597_c0_seq1:423-662(-)